MSALLSRALLSRTNGNFSNILQKTEIVRAVVNVCKFEVSVNISAFSVTFSQHLVVCVLTTRLFHYKVCS